MDKSNDTAASIQFWKVVEAKARLVISSIEYAKHTGNDAAALHAEGFADLQNHIGLAENEMAARMISNTATVIVCLGKSLRHGKSPEEVAKVIAAALGFYVSRD